MMDGEMESVKAKMATHLKDLIANTKLYGWDRVRTYHAVWLNHLEQGRATWEEEEA